MIIEVAMNYVYASNANVVPHTMELEIWIHKVEFAWKHNIIPNLEGRYYWGKF